jgi:hypothetical protein
VLDNWPKDNIVEDGKCVTNTDALSDTFGTTDSDQNKNRHPVSAELGTLPISAGMNEKLTVYNIIYCQVITGYAQEFSSFS